MYCYHIAFCNPCEYSKGIDTLYLELLTKLWRQLSLIPSHTANELTNNELPSSIFKSCENLFQWLPHISSVNNDVLCKNSDSLSEENQWFNLSDSANVDLFLRNLSREINNINWDGALVDNSEEIAERLHNIADSLTDECYILNAYWLTCGHGECVKFSDNIALYGALKRLHTWNNASITFICDRDSLRESKCTGSLFEELDISFVNFQRDENVFIDNVVWQGSLECLQNNENQRGWRLSRTISQDSVESSELTEASSPNSHKNEIPIRQKVFLAYNIKIICELHQSAVPFWKLFPAQFKLYHTSLLKRVSELQETSILDFERDKDTLLLASIATCDRNQSQMRTTKDWIDFISSERSVTCNDKEETESSAVTIETFYFVLYPVEPGIFITYFLRPEISVIDHHSLLAVYQATFPRAVKSQEKSTLYEDCQERRWLQLLDAIQSSQKSPLKSQFSLAVHLDASEMLKHFTKDGKPLRKELKSLLKQIEEKRKLSPTNKKEIQEHHEPTAGVEYCLDNTAVTNANPSLKLLPKHETLSICNTPKTLAKAKLQDVKRAKTETLSTAAADETELARDPASKTSSNDRQSKQSEETRKETKPRLKKHKKSSNGQSNKESETSKEKGDLATGDKSRNKRRSLDGNETVKAPGTNAKEKRSDRHKRRLARVVRRSLIKYGVDPAEEYFTTCSERLYYLCKSFLKDLKTSEGLNNEMKRLADSNVATVVEFEKRRQTQRRETTKYVNS